MINYIIESFIGYSRTKCEFPDEDPLDSCLPVNCHMKYSGFRGFYSTSENKCVEIPKCQSNDCNKQVNTFNYFILKLIYTYSIRPLVEI